MISRAEQWLHDGLSRALECGRGRRATELFVAPHGLRLLKAVTEICYFSAYGSYSTNAEFDAFISSLLRGLFSDERALNLMRFNQRCSTLFLLLANVAIELGALGKGQMEDILKLANIHADFGPERVPFRSLDLLYGLNNLGFQVDQAAWNSAIGCGCTGNARRLSFLSADDAYALTHTIFYRTDFGRQGDAFSGDVRTSIVASLERLCRYCLQVENLDILAECILCLSYLGCAAAVVDPLTAWIASCQRPDGSWQGPAKMDDALESLGVPSTECHFYNDYHTTLLALHAVHATAGSRPIRKRKRVIPIGRPFARSPLSEDALREMITAMSDPADICEVIWIAQALGFCFSNEIAALRAEITKVGVTSNSFRIRKLQFLFGESGARLGTYVPQSDPPCLPNSADSYEELVAYLWFTPHAREAMLRNAIAKYSFEPNPNLYVRCAALGTVWNLWDGDAEQEMSTVIDSFYSSRGLYLWSPQNDDFSTASGAIGRMLLNRRT